MESDSQIFGQYLKTKRVKSIR